VTLGKLQKNKNEEISGKSKKLITKWKSIIKGDKSNLNNHNDNHNSHSIQKIQKSNVNNTNDLHKMTSNSSINSIDIPIPNELVNSNHTDIRNSLKKMFYKAFMEFLPTGFNSTNAVDKSLLIEKKIFDIIPEKTKYINRCKAIVSNLKDPDNEEFRVNILSGKLSPEILAKMEVTEMASRKKKNERTQMEEEAFSAMRSDWNQKHAIISEGMYTCRKCKGKRTTSQEIQMRSADEPMTIFITCVDCGNSWRIG
jgi:transcription elongation factor S-II